MNRAWEQLRETDASWDLFGLNMAAKRDKVETREKIFFFIFFLRLILLNLLFNTLFQQTPFNWKPIQRKPL